MMIMHGIYLIFILISIIEGSYSFRLTGRSLRLRLRSSKSDEDQGGVSLQKLQNVDEDALWLGSQICFWLDNEWIKQPVHGRIGESVSDIYRKVRRASGADLTDMLMEMGTGLEQISFDDPAGDAYVNAWDVANKVSDLLMLRMDRDLCDCMGDMSIFKETSPSTLDVESLKEVASDLSPTFQRYKWLGQYLEGEAEPETVRAVLAIVLGWRVDDTGAISFDSSVSAYGWQQLCIERGDSILAALADPNDDAMKRRLESDLPEDEEVTSIAIEPLAGVEMYKQMTDPARGATLEERRRVLVAKWLYIQNFITGDDFPASRAFVPTNLKEDDEDDEEEED